MEGEILDLDGLKAIADRGIYMEEMDELSILATLNAKISMIKNDGSYSVNVGDSELCEAIRNGWPSLFEQFKVGRLAKFKKP